MPSSIITSRITILRTNILTISILGDTHTICSLTHIRITRYPPAIGIGHHTGILVCKIHGYMQTFTVRIALSSLGLGENPDEAVIVVTEVGADPPAGRTLGGHHVHQWPP